ncbi:MAG: SMP-30/gluconolactonase/LRE family protein [Acidobacteriota bacterium]|nr:SMP-30/gluconolactonase/LRE family protein [Acidobacteriota bacterium]
MTKTLKTMQSLRSNCRRIVMILAAACVLSTPALAHPGSGIAVDRVGQVYFLDTGAGLWKIDANGKLALISGTRFHWLALDANDRFARAQLPSGSDWEILKVGANPTLLLSSDFPIAIGQDGNLYYPSGSAGGLRMIRMMPSGKSSILANLSATARGLPHVNGITAGPDNSLYYTENSAIRRITALGRVSTVATIPAPAGCSSIPGIEADARPYLRGLAVDARGVIYVAASGCGRVLKITPDGKVTTVIQILSPWSPTAVALSGSDLYVLEYLHTAVESRREWVPRVRRISPDGTATIIATVERSA